MVKILSPWLTLVASFLETPHIFIIPMMKHTGKEVEVVWACDQKRGTLCRKECDCNESTGEKEERRPKRR